jgi:hypothetical protein
VACLFILLFLSYKMKLAFCTDAIYLNTSFSPFVRQRLLRRSPRAKALAAAIEQARTV